MKQTDADLNHYSETEMNCNYLNEIDGVQFMPVLSNKRPIHKEWEKTKTKYDMSNCDAVGLVCGAISGGIECIDIDSKYDLTGTLIRDYKRAINDIDGEILKKLVVQETKNGGYHFIYKCKFFEGNKKLAHRHTVESEKEATYRSTYSSSLEKYKKTEATIEKAIELATLEAHRAKENDKVRVLLETRGERGYIACFPTSGYRVSYGDLSNIQEITPEQRDVLFNVAYSFNEVLKENNTAKKLPPKKINGLTPIEDYNDRADVVGLLENHGWRQVGRKGRKILMLRPGETSAQQSGNYDEEKKWFSVFTTSTQFEAQSPYLPYAVYAMLECGGDYKEVPRKLYDLGYGDRQEVIQDNHIGVPSVIDLSNEEENPYLATPVDYESYLHKWRTGQFEMGKTTGMPELDIHFLFKEGNLVIINGVDNVGKSTVIWYLTLLSNLFHGWKWLIFSSENKVGGVIRKLIEFYWGEPIDKMNNAKFNEAKKYITEHFDIIKTSDKLYNYQDILNIATLSMKKKQYKGLMIDPYNSLKVDIKSKSKDTRYDYHYDAASVIQNYARQNNLAIYLNCHVGTQGARNKDKKTGFTLAPQKEDTEGGVMFANKADEFLTVHRLTQHDTEYMFTEIHVRKVKETETGGRQTPLYKPVLLRMTEDLCGFESLGTRDTHHVGTNPIHKWRETMYRKSQQTLQLDNNLNMPKFELPEEDPIDLQF